MIHFHDPRVVEHQLLSGRRRYSGAHRRTDLHPPLPNSGPHDYFVCDACLGSRSSRLLPGTSWSHVVPRYAIHEADLRPGQESLNSNSFIISCKWSPSTNTWFLYNNARVSNQALSLTDDPFHISCYVNDTILKEYRRRSLPSSSPSETCSGIRPRENAMDTIFLQTPRQVYWIMYDRAFTGIE